jgi:hypothetical protein
MVLEPRALQPQSRPTQTPTALSASAVAERICDSLTLKNNNREVYGVNNSAKASVKRIKMAVIVGGECCITL